MLRRRLGKLLFSFAPVLGALLLVFPVAPAQDRDPISWKSKTGAHKISPGATFKVEVIATIDDGWHLYSIEQPAGGPIPTRLWLPTDQKFKLVGDIEAPPPQITFDPNFNIDTQIYDQQAIFTLPIQAAADTPAGKNTLSVSAFYQTCNDKTCLPPKTVKIELAVDITGNPQTTEPTKSVSYAGRRPESAGQGHAVYKGH